MHLPALLTGTVHGRGPLPWTVLRATGIRNTYPLVVLAVAVSVLFHDGVIDQVGPLTLTPALRVMVVVPAILAVACALGHDTVTTPVLARNGRVLAARALSYGTVLVLSAAVVVLGAVLAQADVLAASVRNLLWLTGVALATAALFGIAYSWFPVVLAFTGTMLTQPDDSDWSAYGFLFRDVATPAQLVVAGVIALAGLAVAVHDPRSPGYLRLAGRRAGGAAHRGTAPDVPHLPVTGSRS